MQSIVLRLAAGAALWFAAITPPAIAYARTLPAIDARPNDPGDPQSCWAWFPIATTRPGLERVCAGTFAVDFAVPVDYAGRKFIIVQVARPTDTAQVSCQAFSVNNDGGLVPGDVVDLNTPGSDSFQALRLPSITVNPGGTLWVRCLMARGTRILGIDLINP
jgi:hypothetical protein